MVGFLMICLSTTFNSVFPKSRGTYSISNISTNESIQRCLCTFYRGNECILLCKSEEKIHISKVMMYNQSSVRHIKNICIPTKLWFQIFIFVFLISRTLELKISAPRMLTLPEAFEKKIVYE